MTIAHTYDASNHLKLLIVPATQGSLNTSYVAPFADGGAANRAVFQITVGATTQDVTMALYQAQDSSGTGRKAITGASITAITSSTDECIKTIEISPGAMDDKNGFKYVRAEVVVASAGTTPYSVQLIKHFLRRAGLNDQDSSYAEAIIVP